MKVGTYSIDGQALNYDDLLGVFDVGGRVVPVERVRELDGLEKIVWDPGSREWFERTFPAGAIPDPDTSKGSPVKPTPSAKDTMIGCTAFLVVVVVIVACVFAGCSRFTRDDTPKTSDIVATQTAAMNAITVPDLVSELRVDDSGSTIVTLKYTKEAIGGVEGDNKVSQVTSVIASNIFLAVPQVSSVGVFDANNKMIDVYTRPE